MTSTTDTEHIETIVVGGGQAGLSVGYHLQRLGQEFVILDANERVGDSWRNRWDSLRLFTPAKFNGLDGYPFPAPGNAPVTKDEMGDYLESYVDRFRLPVRNGMRVNRLTRNGKGFELEAGVQRFTADHVVVAMGNHQCPRIPGFATRLDPAIVQLHGSEYRNPSQLRDGPVLLVGAGNSGAEIAKEVSQRHQTWIAGRDVGQIPFRVTSFLGLNFFGPLVLRVVFHRVLTLRTPMGRRMRPKVLQQSGPLIRVKRKELAALGVNFAPRVDGVEDGKPRVEDGRVLDVANVIWCTGFHPGFTWIDLPVHGELEPAHRRGVVEKEPGLYFVGLEFQYALSSEMIQGVGRDARYVARHLAKHRRAS